MLESDSSIRWYVKVVVGRDVRDGVENYAIWCQRLLSCYGLDKLWKNLSRVLFVACSATAELLAIVETNEQQNAF